MGDSTKEEEGASERLEVRQLAVPAGCDGLAFKSQRASLIITEVPQVLDVEVGTRVLTVNGERPNDLASRICREGDTFNHCTEASPPHSLGQVGKFASPPCPSCDFDRLSRSQGLDVALMKWIKAVKRDKMVTLGVVVPKNSTRNGSSAGSTSALDNSQHPVVSPSPATSQTVRLRPRTRPKEEAVEELLKEVAELPPPGTYLRFLQPLPDNLDDSDLALDLSLAATASSSSSSGAAPIDATDAAATKPQPATTAQTESPARMTTVPNSSTSDPLILKSNDLSSLSDDTLAGVEQRFEAYIASKENMREVVRQVGTRIGMKRKLVDGEMIRKRTKLLSKKGRTVMIDEARERKPVVLRPNDVAGGSLDADTQRLSSTSADREETKVRPHRAAFEQMPGDEVNGLPASRFQPSIKPVPKASLREQGPRSRAPLPRKQAPSKVSQPRGSVVLRRDAVESDLAAGAAPPAMARSSQDQAARPPVPPRPTAKPQLERGKESWSEKMKAVPWRKNESNASRGDVGGPERSYDASASDGRIPRRLSEGTAASARPSRGEAADSAQPRGQVASARPERRPSGSRPVFGQAIGAVPATLKSSTVAASSTHERFGSVKPAEPKKSSVRSRFAGSIRLAPAQTQPRQPLPRRSLQRSVASPVAKGGHPDRRLSRDER